MRSSEAETHICIGWIIMDACLCRICASPVAAELLSLEGRLYALFAIMHDAYQPTE